MLLLLATTTENEARAGTTLASRAVQTEAQPSLLGSLRCLRGTKSIVGDTHCVSYGAPLAPSHCAGGVLGKTLCRGSAWFVGSNGSRWFSEGVCSRQETQQGLGQGSVDGLVGG